MVRYAMLVLSLVATTVQAEDLSHRREVAKKVVDCSVFVEANSSAGSGVAIRRGGQLYVLTNWHVVENNRKVEADGGVSFKDVVVVKFGVFDGKTAARRDCAAEIVAFSDDDKGYDLAVLRVRDPKFLEVDTEFYPASEEIPFVGMPLYHVGCLNGSEAPGSLTTGIVNGHGRIIGDHIFDQVSVTNFPGSSGGGVFDPEGRCIGILTRRTGETLGYIDPIREIRVWAKTNDVEWVLDPNLPAPDRDKLVVTRNSYRLPGDVKSAAAVNKPPTDADMEKAIGGFLDAIFKVQVK